MTDWWHALTPELKVFYGIGLISLMVVVVQMLMTLVGFDTDGLDGGFDMDIGEVDASTGIGLFSSQTLGAFFLGFGWMGAAAISNGASVMVGVLLAALCGVGAMFAMFYMIKSLLRLQSRGNLDYSTVIGQEGTVYVTLPGNDQDGGGQIQILIQGRLTTARARKISEGSVPPGQRVRVTAINGPASFVVETI
jgi:membrane protein implicated in regulation of membrane protease activity